jgi:hypothetical protein
MASRNSGVPGRRLAPGCDSGDGRFVPSKIVENVLRLLRNRPRHLYPTWPTRATWSKVVIFRVKRLLIIRGEEVKVVECTRSTARGTPKSYPGCERHHRLIPIRRAIREERQRVHPVLANRRGSVSCAQQTTNQARAIEAAHLATYPIISMSCIRDIWQVWLFNRRCYIDSRVVGNHFLRLCLQ